MPSKKTIDLLLQRFGGATPEMLDRVLTPYRLRLVDISTESAGQRKSRTVFRAEVPKEVWTTFEEGTTGKVVPKEYVEGMHLGGRSLRAEFFAHCLTTSTASYISTLFD